MDYIRFYLNRLRLFLQSDSKFRKIGILILRNWRKLIDKLLISNKKLFYTPLSISKGNGFVTFLDDDGSKEVYTRLKPLFESRGEKFTSCVITGLLDNDGYMTWDDVVDLHSNGFDIQSHAVTNRNFTTITEKEQLDEMINSKLHLIEHGINPKYIIYPQGGYTNFTLKNVLKYYQGACAGTTSTGVSPPLTITRVPRIGLGSWQQTRRMKQLKTICLNAKKQGRWLIFMTHIYEPSAQVPVEGNYESIEMMLDFCIANNIEIVTLDEGFSRMEIAKQFDASEKAPNKLSKLEL